MKVNVNQAELVRALSLGTKSLLARANLPVLSNVLIAASSRGIEITSTDLETATKTRLACNVETEGQTTVQGRTFFEFVSQLPAIDVTLEKLGEELVINAGGYSARLATMPAEEFPAIPKIEKGISFKLAGRQLATSVERVAYCAAQDEARPILTGVLCELSKDKLSMIATDGYRLSFDEVPVLDKPGVPAIKIIVPARAMQEVAKIVGETKIEEGEVPAVEVLVSENLSQVNFRIQDAGQRIEGVEFTSRLIEGDFPNWQKIIPAAFATRARVNRQEFTKLAKVASIFARESGNIVKLKLAGGEDKKATLAVFAQGSQIGSADAKCEVEMNGKGGEIAFNFRYLLEALSAIDDEDVLFEMNESLNPGRITPQAAKGPYFHIIMPVRLQS